MTRVKVCGLTRAEDVATVVTAGADAVGAIVDVPVDTPREVSPETATALFDAVPPFVSTVLVTMPESLDRARELVATIEPDAVQIHGGLSEAAVGTLAAEESVDVVVAVDAGDATAAHEYATEADAILVDSTDASGAGGTGRTHDWDSTRAIREAIDVPLVLAGGLTPDSVAEAISVVDPFAVDVASGVEASPGVKDPAAVRAFVARAHARRVDA